VSGRVARRQEERYAEKTEPVYASAPPPEPEPEAAAAPGPSPEAIEQLKQIAALKDQGILTEEEFAAQKAKILGT
jgi:hypothetical protein